jgi:hypothetical protein
MKELETSILTTTAFENNIRSLFKAQLFNISPYNDS